MTFAYDITVCIHNKISTASNIMFKAHAIIKHGDSNSDVLICFDTKFNLRVS